jgi:hypothetical protein
MPQDASTQPQTLKVLSDTIARQLAGGKSHKAAIQALVERGWPEVSARQFVANAEHLSDVYKAIAEECRCQGEECKRLMLRGVLWVVAGVCIVVLGLMLENMAVSFILFAVGVIVAIVESIDFMHGVTGWWEQILARRRINKRP